MLAIIIIITIFYYYYFITSCNTHLTHGSKRSEIKKGHYFLSSSYSSICPFLKPQAWRIDRGISEEGTICSDLLVVGHIPNLTLASSIPFIISVSANGLVSTWRMGVVLLRQWRALISYFLLWLAYLDGEICFSSALTGDLCLQHDLLVLDTWPAWGTCFYLSVELFEIWNICFPCQCSLRPEGNWDEAKTCPIFFLGILCCDPFLSCCQKQVSQPSEVSRQ